jgi:hypothetical protein
VAFPWQTGLVDPLTAAIAVTWPQCRKDSGGGGIHEVDRVMRVDYERIVDQIGAPYAVIVWAPLMRNEYTVTQKAWDVPLAFDYVARTEGGVQHVREQLEAMEDYLMATGLGSSASVEEVTGLDWSPEHEDNAVFFRAQIPLIAGRIAFRVVCGEV